MKKQPVAKPVATAVVVGHVDLSTRQKYIPPPPDNHIAAQADCPEAKKLARSNEVKTDLREKLLGAMLEGGREDLVRVYTGTRAKTRKGLEQALQKKLG